ADGFAAARFGKGRTPHRICRGLDGDESFHLQASLADRVGVRFEVESHKHRRRASREIPLWRVSEALFVASALRLLKPELTLEVVFGSLGQERHFCAPFARGALEQFPYELPPDPLPLVPRKHRGGA